MPDRCDPTGLGLPDATSVDAAFAHPAFAPLKGAGAWFVLGIGEPPRLAWANSAALRSFRSFDDAQVALFGPGGLASRLPAEARAATPDSAPRLARVALPWRLATRSATVLYRRKASPPGEALLAVAVAAAGMDPGTSRAKARGAPTHWRDGAEADQDGGDAVDLAPTRATPPPADARATAPAARLLWRTDALGLLRAFDDGPLRALGVTGLPSLAQALTETIATFDPSGAERLARLTSGRATWSGVDIAWPTADGGPPVLVSFSASAVFGAERRFDGFRGFATVRGPGRPAPAPTGGVGPVGAAEPPAEGVGPRAADAGQPRLGPTRDTEAADDAAPTSPSNVVHLRPALGAPPVHTQAPPGPIFRAMDAPVPAAGNDADVRPPAEHLPRSGGDLAAGDLTSDEREAFHEIGLRLGGSDGRGPDLPDASARPDGAPAQEPRDAPTEPADRAAWAAGPDASAFEREAGDARELRAILEGTGDAIAILDEGGRILALNSRAVLLFGRDARGRPDDAFSTLLAPGSRAAADALLAAFRDGPGDGEECRRNEVLAQAADGRPLPSSMTLGRLGPGRLYALWREVPADPATLLAAPAPSQTARPSSRGELGVLARFGHEIRGPLNAILGFAEIMLDERFGSLGNPRAKGYLQDIHASGTRVVSLIDDLVDLSRIEAGEEALDRGPLDINRLIGDAVALTQAQAHRERIIMRTSLAGRLPQALADERSVRQILSNLLSNAVKFNEPGGQVIVSSALSDTGGVAVRIRDTGIGMSDEVLADALEPLNARSSTAGGGTRLGLPITKALVGANGATLAIRSRPGEGTLVEVVFPASVTPAARVSA